MRTTDDAKDTSLIHPVSFQPTANKPQDELQNSLKQLITKNLILSLLSMLLKQGFCFWPPKRRTQWLRSHAPNTIKYILPEFLCRTTPLHCCLIHSDARGEFISYNHQDLAASNRQGPFFDKLNISVNNLRSRFQLHYYYCFIHINMYEYWRTLYTVWTLKSF